MDTYRIFTSEGKSLRFRGERIASVQSNPIQTAHGEVWFELNAYRHENQQWVTTIAMNSSGSASDEVFDFYCTVLLASAEDFLYDFEPVRILPDDLVASGLPEHRPLIAAADQSYYAAVRRLTREMQTHEENRLRDLQAPESVANVPRATYDGVISRIKHWLRT